MVDPDLAVLASDIRALSTFLNAADYYWWPSASRTEGMDAKSFSHISTLLGFGTDAPVAITGTIAAENVAATIVCPRRPDRQQQPAQELVKSRSVRPSTRSLSEIVHNTPQGLEGYVADLIDLFRIVQSREIPSTTIIQWVIHRGWFKLRSRMNRSETDFKDDLFSLMDAWSPDCDDCIPERVVQMPITRSIYDKYPYLTVNRTNEGTTFLLNKATASTLVKMIARIFTDIRQTIADPNVNRSDAAFALVNSFIWLHGVLANRHVEALMTETSLRFALVPKWPERAGHEHADGWEPLPGPNCMRENYYGLRYLRMLVACATSVFRLDDPKILPLLAATNATIVSLAAPPHDAESERRRVVQAVIEEIKRNVPADARWPESASEWIWSLADTAAVSEEQETSCHLHAEAGLTAVACEARLSRNDGDKRDKYGSAFSDLARTPIGISGKCCPLCLRLTQLLNTHFASLGDSEALVFSQPETHGKVLPWDPPQFGLPKSVLAQLRDELREKLVEKAIAVGKLGDPEVDSSGLGSDGHKYKDILAIQGKIRLPDGVKW